MNAIPMRPSDPIGTRKVPGKVCVHTRLTFNSTKRPGLPLLPECLEQAGFERRTEFPGFAACFQCKTDCGSEVSLRPPLYWRVNTIRLFNKWSIGNYSRAIRPIEPNEMHVYPDIMGHTKELPLCRDTMREQFPMSSLRLDDRAIAARREQVNRNRRPREKSDIDNVDRSKYTV